MSTEKEARVRFSVDGDDEVARAAGRVQTAWQSAGDTIASGFKAVGGAIASAVSGVLSDLGHVVTAAGAINFASSVEQVNRFEESVARMGVGANRSIGSVQDGMNALGRRIGEMPNVTAGLVQGLALAGNVGVESAAAAEEGLAKFAAQTGQAIGQVQGVGIALEQLYGGAVNVDQALARATAQANAMGTVGGPKVLGDMIQRLQAQLSLLSSAESPGSTTALLAGFGGKGMTAQQRERALSTVMGKIESDPEGFERFLGHKITDEYGHVKDMTGVMKELADYGKKGQYQHMRGRFTFGAEGEAALEHTDFDAIRNAADLHGSAAGDSALERLKQSAPGQRMDQEIRKNVSMQGTVGSGSWLGQARQWLGDLSADHPVTAGLGIAVGSKLVSGLSSDVAKLLGGAGAGAAVATKLAGGSGAAAATTAEAATAEGGLALGGGLGFGGLAALGGVGASMLATYKTLSQLGEASAAKQGFSNRTLSQGEAADLASRAQAAEAAAAGERSPGMQAAMQAELALKQRRAAAQSSAETAAAPMSAKDEQLIATMKELGASMELIHQTLEANKKAPVVEVINATGGTVEARVRGEQ